MIIWNKLSYTTEYIMFLLILIHDYIMKLAEYLMNKKIKKEPVD